MKYIKLIFVPLLPKYIYFWMIYVQLIILVLLYKVKQTQNK